MELSNEFDERFLADVDADLSANQLTEIRERFLRGRVGPAPGKWKHALEQPLKAACKLGGAANLRDLHDFHQERRNVVRIVHFLEPSAQDEHDGDERRLTQVARRIETHRPSTWRRCKAEFRPEPPARKPQPVYDRGEDRVEKHEPAIGGEDRAVGRNESVRESHSLMECTESGQRFDEVSERGVQARDEGFFSRRFEEIREPDAGDELRHDRQLAGGRDPLCRIRSGEATVFEDGQVPETLANRGLESGQLRAHVQALEHRPGFPVEAQLTSSEAVGVAGRGDRDGGFKIRCRHCRQHTGCATRAPADQFRRTAVNPLFRPFVSESRRQVRRRRRAETVSADCNPVSAIQC